MIIAVIGGRDRDPSLAEIERVVVEVGAATTVRYSTATAPRKQGTERTIARFVKSRGLAVVEPWPTRMAALLGDLERPPADLLIALAGGEDTRRIVATAKERMVPIVEVEPVAEPRIWNRHHGDPPWMYIGGNDRDPSSASPLANPFRSGRGIGPLDSILDKYRRWLWERINPASLKFDHAVVAAIDALTPEHFVVCSCWPNPCHGEAVIRAWRWRRAQAGGCSSAAVCGQPAPPKPPT